MPELENAGLTAEVYHAGLEAYCVSYSLWKEAIENVFDKGTVVKAPKSGHPMQNPYLSIANKQFTNMHKIMAEFGLTPSSKTKIVVGDAKGMRPAMEGMID